MGKGIKLRILTWRDYLKLFEWAQYDHKGPYNKEAGESEKEGVRTEAKVRRCCTAVLRMKKGP